MPTISANVPKKELDVIREYANVCGETMSNCIRKSMIRQATFMDGGSELSEYICMILVSDNVSDNVSDEDETTIIQKSFNKIRGILRMDDIKIWKNR